MGKKSIWYIVSFMLSVALTMMAKSVFQKMFPEITINYYWLWGYLALIFAATFHYNEDSVRFKITILFIVIPVSLLFLLTWIFKDMPGPYGHILKTNLPRSMLTAGLVCFLYYTFRINPNDTLIKARQRKALEDEQAQRKKDWEDKTNK